MRSECIGIVFGLLLTLPTIASATSHEGFKIAPAFHIDDVSFYRFASNFVGLLRSFSNDWHHGDQPPNPNYLVFSESNAIKDGQIVSPRAFEVLNAETWEFVRSKRSSSEWCKVISVYSTVRQTRVTIVFIDEIDSTVRGRKNCLLASLINLYELDIHIPDYFEKPAEALALDILTEFASKATADD